MNATWLHTKEEYYDDITRPAFYIDWHFIKKGTLFNLATLKKQLKQEKNEFIIWIGNRSNTITLMLEW